MGRTRGSILCTQVSKEGVQKIWHHTLSGLTQTVCPSGVLWACGAPVASHMQGHEGVIWTQVPKQGGSRNLSSYIFWSHLDCYPCGRLGGLLGTCGSSFCKPCAGPMMGWSYVPRSQRSKVLSTLLIPVSPRLWGCGNSCCKPYAGPMRGGQGDHLYPGPKGRSLEI